MIATHRNDLAEAYTVYLFDDYAQAKPVIDATLGRLKFLP
jgi:hypothetical protein